MQLILWRHAEAEERLPDEARALTARGRDEAERMARWLRARLPEGVRVLASPALRARQTAAALTECFETSERVGPAARAAEILEAAGWPHGRSPVLVVGHQPALGQAAALILTGAPAEWAIAKGALWWFESGAGGEVRLRAVLGPEWV